MGEMWKWKGEYIGETSTREENRDCRGKEEGEINVKGCEKDGRRPPKFRLKMNREREKRN